MKIVIMPSWYESSENEQEGAFFRDQAEALYKAGNEVTVIVAHIVNWPYKDRKKWYKISEYNKRGIRVIYTKIPTFGLSSISPVFFAMFTLSYQRLFNYFLRDSSADIVYAHSFWPAGYAAIKIKDKYGIPVVIQEHRSTINNETIPKSSWKYLKKTVEEADLFWAVSRHLKDVIEKKTHIFSKIDVMPNMVNPIFFERRNRKEHEKVIFLSIGNLIPIKKMDLLIETFKNTLLKDSELWIVGDGPERQKLQQIIDNNIGNKVRLLGKKNKAEIADLMNISDIFVMVSESETFGVVYIEALAMGIPVVAAKNGGADDIIDYNNGILIDVNNKAQLKKALYNIRNQYLQYNTNEISKSCWNKYSSEVIVEKQMHAFSNLVGHLKNEKE